MQTHVHASKTRYIFQEYRTHIKHMSVPMVGRGMGLGIRNDMKNKIMKEESCLRQILIWQDLRRNHSVLRTREFKQIYLFLTVRLTWLFINYVTLGSLTLLGLTVLTWKMRILIPNKVIRELTECLIQCLACNMHYIHIHILLILFL